MELGATSGSRKRALDEAEIAVAPSASLKKRKVDEENADLPSASGPLDSIAFAVSGVLGHGRKAAEARNEGAPIVENGASLTKAAPQPLSATSPNKARPAIKLAALLGSKWDTGDSQRPPSPKKGRGGRRKAAAVPNESSATESAPVSSRGRGRGRARGGRGGRGRGGGRGRPRKEEVDEGNIDANTDEAKAETAAVPHESPSTVRSLKRPDFMPLSNGITDTTADEFSTNEYPTISPLKTRSVNLTQRLAESTGAVATPKGILSPSKKRGRRPQKNVSFHTSIDAEAPAEVFFEDLPKEPSAKKKPGRKPKQAQPAVVVAADEIVCGVCSRPDSQAPNEIILCDNCDFAVHQMCYGVQEIPEGDWLCKSCAQEGVLGLTKKPTEEAPEIAADAVAAPAMEVPDIPNLDYHLRTLQRVLLDRCNGRRSIRMFGQQDQYEKAHQLIEQTVAAGEGNSMLLIGPRGCGKTTMINNIVKDMSREHGQDFHVVRLNGFIHTDDKLALKEIWRQLGKEMKVEDDLLNRSNYADTMASLLALLSHPSEILGLDEGVTSQSVIFIIDEFDLFAAHARQTLLYNLFDIAQSRKAPIAVLGCTTRLDVVEMLEKRVKSRFSHRYIYLSLPKNLAAFWQVCRQGLMLGDVEPEEEGLDRSSGLQDLYKQRAFQDLLQYHYYTTKSPSAFFNEWILPLSWLTAGNLNLDVPAVGSELTSLAPPDSRLHLLSTLSDLDLGLLIAAARLDIVADTDTVNFAMAYDEYSTLAGRQRVQSATAGMLARAGNARVWSRGVAAVAWERLVTLGLLVPAGVGAGSRSQGHGGLEAKMWRVDVALEEIPVATKLSTVLAKWCKEI
ncbi:hypothetical protein Trco_000580 [Trichoderma cornu-damae]|uniref:Origin recognition complex subunit 4 n=1 Tax=Trichoderma cornu-damae TaxID=654480 RepID=A0A9P8QVM6_9HYPO|nr:hypothetical protein Trco_000580 [Trichoderma cornu-damae]